MKKYRYKAKDWNGKTVRGSMEALGESEVISSIKSNGLVPIRVDEETLGFFDDLRAKFRGGMGLKQISTFTRQLSTMMTAGLPLTDALSMLKIQSPEGSMIYRVVDECLNSVRGGQPLAKGIEKYQKNFGEAYVASIKAGEEGGVLEEVLEKLADNLEAENEFRSKVKGAMVYPVIVIIGMIVVVFIMMVFVIPKLMSMYTELGSEMPTSTKIMMALSDLTVKLWFLFPLLPIGFYSLMKIGSQYQDFRLKRDKVYLKIPIMGELNQKTIIANTNRSLSMLLGAGLSLTDSLRIVAGVSGSEVYRQAYVKISERVEKGFSIQEAFEETGVFPVIVNQMVATGEATGKLDEVLMRVADYFSAEAQQSVKALTSAIEPLIMIALGIGVAFLVIAVIMPIYNLTSQF